MYHWIADKSLLGSIKALCSDIVNRLVQAINNEGALIVRQHLIGCEAKNLIVQNADLPIDLEYSLEIVRAVEYGMDDCRGINEYVGKKFNAVLNGAGWGVCGASASEISTESRRFADGDQTAFRIDLCIVKAEDDGKRYRLTHQSSASPDFDRYFWKEAKSSSGYEIRARWLKQNGLWNEVREAYLDKKNLHLSSEDGSHTSFTDYIEAVNEAYWKHACADRP